MFIEWAVWLLQLLDMWHPLERAQYPQYFERRHQRKLEYIERWEKKYGKPHDEIKALEEKYGRLDDKWRLVTAHCEVIHSTMHVVLLFIIELWQLAEIVTNAI